MASVDTRENSPLLLEEKDLLSRRQLPSMRHHCTQHNDTHTVPIAFKTCSSTLFLTLIKVCIKLFGIGNRKGFLSTKMEMLYLKKDFYCTLYLCFNFLSLLTALNACFWTEQWEINVNTGSRCYYQVLKLSFDKYCLLLLIHFI